MSLNVQKGIAVAVVVFSQISVIGRNTQGVKIMNLDGNDKLVSVAKIIIDK